MPDMTLAMDTQGRWQRVTFIWSDENNIRRTAVLDVSALPDPVRCRLVLRLNGIILATVDPWERPDE